MTFTNSDASASTLPAADEPDLARHSAEIAGIWIIRTDEGLEESAD